MHLLQALSLVDRQSGGQGFEQHDGPSFGLTAASASSTSEGLGATSFGGREALTPTRTYVPVEAAAGANVWQGAAVPKDRFLEVLDDESDDDMDGGITTGFGALALQRRLFPSATGPQCGRRGVPSDRAHAQTDAAGGHAQRAKCGAAMRSGQPRAAWRCCIWVSTRLRRATKSLRPRASSSRSSWAWWSRARSASCSGRLRTSRVASATIGAMMMGR